MISDGIKDEVRRRASLKVGSPSPASPWPESIQEEGDRLEATVRVEADVEKVCTNRFNSR